MNAIEIVFLLGITITLAALPSSSSALVVARSAMLGLPNGIAVCFGIIMGDLVFILLVLLGLSVVAEAMGNLFLVIKYVGAAYLIWLGAGLLSSDQKPSGSIGQALGAHNFVASVFAGFFVTLADVKAISFYLSLFPTFVDLPALNVTDILIIASLMAFSVGGVKVVYAFSATKVASLVRKHRFYRATRKTAGSLMIGIGGYALAKP